MTSNNLLNILSSFNDEAYAYRKKNMKFFIEGWIVIYGSLLMVPIFSHIKLMVFWKINLNIFGSKMIKKMCSTILKLKLLSLCSQYYWVFFFVFFTIILQNKCETSFKLPMKLKYILVEISRANSGDWSKTCGLGRTKIIFSVILCKVEFISCKSSNSFKWKFKEETLGEWSKICGLGRTMINFGVIFLFLFILFLAFISFCCSFRCLFSFMLFRCFIFVYLYILT